MKPKFDDGYEDGYVAGLRKAVELIHREWRWMDEGSYKNGIRWAASVVTRYIHEEEVK